MIDNAGMFLAGPQSSDWVALSAVVISLVTFYLNRRHAILMFHATQVPYISIEPLPSIEKAFRVVVGNHSQDVEIRDVRVRALTGCAVPIVDKFVLTWIELDTQVLDNILPGQAETLSIPGAADKPAFP